MGRLTAWVYTRFSKRLSILHRLVIVPLQGFIQDFTAGRVGQVKGHVILEMFSEISTNGEVLGITKAT